MKVSPVRLATIAAAALTLALTSAPAYAAHRGALWLVVRTCVLNSRVTGSPWPCLAVDRGAGTVVIGDPKRRTQVLVTPTVHIAGLESSVLQAPGAPNYWRAAWAARGWLDRRAGAPVPAEHVGVAVNSLPGRTQDELHLHLDCLRPSVRRAVDQHVDAIGESWSELAKPLVRGHRYLARWLAQEALATSDPFRLLVDPAVGDLRDWTLVMVAAHRSSGERGFVLLSHRADLIVRDLAAGKELLDHRCTSEPVAAVGGKL